MCTLEKRGSLFILTLTGETTEHRLHPTLISHIRSLLSQVRSEATTGSVLITTAQGKFFSNGLDLAWATSAPRSEPQSGFKRLQLMVNNFKPLIADLFSLPLPTIAAVTGHAAAAGLLLALSHDYVLMRNDRGVIYMSEVDMGMTFPDYFTVLLRSKIVSPIARRDVILRAAKLKAEQAVEMNIIDSAHGSAEETVDAALRLAEKLGARKWNGEVYSEIRKDTFAEISKVLGLEIKPVVVAKL